MSSGIRGFLQYSKADSAGTVIPAGPFLFKSQHFFGCQLPKIDPRALRVSHDMHTKKAPGDSTRRFNNFFW
jgi:hypothetical protein